MAKAASAKSLDGQALTPAVKDGRVTVNGVNVVKADIDTGNGVIHVVDAVLMPQ